MQTKNVGHMSAWSLARSRGYTGTREEFAQLMADYATVAERAAQSAQDAENAKEYVDEQTQIALQAARDATASAQSASGAHEDAASARTSAQNALQSENDALNYKNIAQRQAENSEAWAVGTRDGVDVGAQDETYHNNAKYYAGQLDTAVETATTAATNASQSAQDAATSASQAAESARTLTIDTTLTKEGQAADAKAVGDKIEGVNDVLKDTVVANIFNNYTPVTGKYYDGNEGSNPTYNYYVVPVLKGVKYMVLPRMRMRVIKQGSTTIETDLDEKTSFTSTVNGTAYITVYASDTPELFVSNIDDTLSIIGKSADAKATGSLLIPTHNHVTNYDYTVFASDYVEGKYYGTNGAAETSASYNYYAKIPVVAGNTYHFVGGRGARYVVLRNNNVIVQTAETTTVFTAQYDGDLYVTEYSATPLKMYLYNDFHKLETWTNANINGRVGTSTSNTIAFTTNDGDICHFKLNGYSGQYFTNCLLYAVQTGGNVIVASLYSDTGEYVFIAPSATSYIVYVNKAQSETATIDFGLTNLSKNTIFNSITRHDIVNRFMPHIYGKKIACLGDSFTYGVATYVAKMNSRYLSKAKNYGVASSRIVLDTMSGGTTIQSFLNRYASMDDDADIVTVFGGINDSYDIGSGVLALGDISSDLDTTTFYGGLKLLVTNLMKKYPDKQIIGIIPPDCQVGQYYIDNLPVVQNAEREVYNMYGIPIIDIKRECYKMSTLAEMVSLYRAAVDNIHPSNAGQEALCDTISAGIRRIIL